MKKKMHKGRRRRHGRVEACAEGYIKRYGETLGILQVKTEKKPWYREGRIPEPEAGPAFLQVFG